MIVAQTRLKFAALAAGRMAETVLTPKLGEKTPKLAELQRELSQSLSRINPQSSLCSRPSRKTMT